LICSSLIYHSDWQEQTTADVVEPDVPSEVECLMLLLLAVPSKPSTSELGDVDIWVGCDRDAAVMTGGHAFLWLAFLQTILPLSFICLLCGGTYFDEKESSTSLFLTESR
jgi:hypothetical protein